MAVPPPSDRRFRRPHVRPPVPGRRRSRLAVAAAGGGCVLALAAFVSFAGMLRTTDALAVREITVVGDTWLARGEVLALLGDLHGMHIATLDLEQWRQTLLGSPWVADVTLRRTLPGTVTVTITERRPMGIARLDGELYLIDEHATIIDLFGPPHAALDLPIIDGLATGSAAGEAVIDERRAALASRLLAELEHRPDLAARVSQIDVSDPHDAALILEDDTARLRLGHEHFLLRLQTYLEIADALQQQVSDIDYVDLRFDERVFLKTLPPRVPAGADPSAGRGAGQGTSSGIRSGSGRG